MSDPAWIQNMVSELAAKYLTAEPEWSPWLVDHVDEFKIKPFTLCFARCGSIAVYTREYPPPVGRQNLCSPCAYKQDRRSSIIKFLKNEWLGPGRSDRIGHACRGEAVVLMVLKYMLQWFIIDVEAGVKGSIAMQRVTPTSGAHPLDRAHIEHLHGKMNQQSVPVFGGDRCALRLVDHWSNQSVELYRTGLRNGLTCPQISQRIKDELLGNPSDVRKSSGYPPDIHAIYNAEFNRCSQAHPSDRSTWSSDVHSSIHSNACREPGSVYAHVQEHGEEVLQSVLTAEPFRLKNSDANHSHTLGKLESPLPSKENRQLGNIDQQAIRLTHRTNHGRFDPIIYERALDDILQGLEKYVVGRCQRLEDIFQAIAKNPEWSAMVSTIAAGDMTPVPQFYQLMTLGELAPLCKAYFRYIKAERMTGKQMMDMVILAT